MKLRIILHSDIVTKPTKYNSGETERRGAGYLDGRMKFRGATGMVFYALGILVCSYQYARGPFWYARKSLLSLEHFCQHKPRHRYYCDTLRPCEDWNSLGPFDVCLLVNNFIISDTPIEDTPFICPNRDIRLSDKLYYKVYHYY
jgi:hypothetical protein